MEPKKRDYIQTFTTLGLALCVLEGLRYLGNGVYGAVAEWVGNREAGVFRPLSWLFFSDWTGMLVQYVFILGLPYLAVLFLVRRIPKWKGPRRPVSLKTFAVLLVIALGMGYLFNIAGNVINLLFSAQSGKALGDMNPVTDMVTDLSPDMILYVCFLAPFMEELLFRGILLSRARRFGDRTAVIFCAVLFGLMHGNLTQFLYATAIGLILGYLAVITGTIRYNVLLHMGINSLSVVFLSGFLFLADRGFVITLMMYSLGTLLAVFLMIGFAVAFLAKYWSAGKMRLAFFDGEPSPYRKYAYLNVGFLLYAAICGAQMLFYLLY